MINPETVKVYNFFERVDNLKRNLCRLKLKEKHKQKEKNIPLYQMYATKGELTLTYSKMKELSNYFKESNKKYRASLNAMKSSIKNKVLIEYYNKFFPHPKGETPKVKQIFTLDECSKQFENKPLVNSNSTSCYSTIKNEHRKKRTFLPIQQAQKNNKTLVKSISMPKIVVKKNKEELLESFMNEYKGILRKIKREKMKFIKRNIQSMDEIDKMMDTRAQIEVFKLKEKYKSLSMTNVNY